MFQSTSFEVSGCGGKSQRPSSEVSACGGKSQRPSFGVSACGGKPQRPSSEVSGCGGKSQRPSSEVFPSGGGRESLWFLRPFGSKRPEVERDIPFIFALDFGNHGDRLLPICPRCSEACLRFQVPPLDRGWCLCWSDCQPAADDDAAVLLARLVSDILVSSLLYLRYLITTFLPLFM